MDNTYLAIFGGIGLFLLGMLIFTDGLKQLAGDAFRRLLTRFTRGPLSAAATGAVATGLVQSSTAVTVTAVGFVGAGLLTFPQALGIVFGANIGSTLTGWLVALVGFKLKLGLVGLPLLFVGVLLKRFGSGRLAAFGWALAGFSLLFVGLSALQTGMAPLQDVITPQSLPGSGYGGRLLLLAFGAGLTVVTQSSGVGVATMLVALATGTVGFQQAAAAVIGMDIGTTFSAALAAFGGSTAMRRTGYAHVIFNLMTGIAAFFLLDLYVWAAGHCLSLADRSDAQLALVGFHSLFNTVGVAAALPFTHRFARLIERLVPEAGPPLLRHLDERLLKDAGAASDALLACLRDIANELFALLACLMQPQREIGWRERQRLHEVRAAIDSARHYVERIRSEPREIEARRRHAAAMHTLDHLSRLAFRCTQEDRLVALTGEPRLRRLAHLLRAAVERTLMAPDLTRLEPRLDRVRERLREQRHAYRDATVTRASNQEIDAATTLRRLDANRWLHRTAYHLWRIVHHLAEAGDIPARRLAPADGTKAPPPPAA